MKPEVTIDTKKKQDIRRAVLAEVSERAPSRRPYGIWALLGSMAALAAFVFVVIPTTPKAPSEAPVSYTAFAETAKDSGSFLSEKKTTKILAYERRTKKSPVYLKYRSKMRGK